jgi:uncharacterized PurR-regulated membrane protein YhhQ (DUF165 family)
MFTKKFVFRVLVSIMGVVFFFIVALVISALIGFEEANEIYQLVVVDTLVKPFVGIISAFVAYAFGKNAAELIRERNRLKYGASPEDSKIDLL